MTRDGAVIGYGESVGRSRVVLRSFGTGTTVVDSGPTTRCSPSFSPDGRWVAYQEHGTGKPQVYIRPMTGSACQLS